jgi:hypothetical protein
MFVLSEKTKEPILEKLFHFKTEVKPEQGEKAE